MRGSLASCAVKAWLLRSIGLGGVHLSRDRARVILRHALRRPWPRRFRCLPPPREFLLARPETGEIAAAGSAAIRRRSHAQQDRGPSRRTIILLAPGGQFLAVATRAARVSPCVTGPHAGLPARPAAAATQLVNPQAGLTILSQSAALRNTDLAFAALWTGQLHLGN